MGLHWATQNCPNSKFYFFVDDDHFVSIKNLIRFIENPSDYPESRGAKHLMSDDKNVVRNHGTDLLINLYNCRA